MTGPDAATRTGAAPVPVTSEASSQNLHRFFNIPSHVRVGLPGDGTWACPRLCRVPQVPPPLLREPGSRSRTGGGRGGMG
jgi:hypothetical protein